MNVKKKTLIFTLLTNEKKGKKGKNLKIEQVLKNRQFCLFLCFKMQVT